MKKAKVVLAGALVLALGLVMGCKSDSSGDSDWTINEKSTKQWEKTNSSETQYARAFEQFGTTKGHDKAIVKLTVGDMTASKAGLVFAYDDFTIDKTGKKYFLLGVGGYGYAQGTNNGEYFLSYYENVKLDNLSGSFDSETPSGSQQYSLFGNSKIGKPVSILGPGMTVYVSVSETAVEGTEAKKVTIEIGSDYDASSKKISDPMTLEFQIGAVANNKDSSFSEDVKAKLKTIGSIKGGIGAYGMVTRATSAGAKSSTNKYEVIVPGTVMSAE